MPSSRLPPYGNSTLPSDIRSCVIDNINGIAMHVLEADFPAQDRPCILLLHGFPELAYSWRKIMLPLAAAGYYVVAPVGGSEVTKPAGLRSPPRPRRLN